MKEVICTDEKGCVLKKSEGDESQQVVDKEGSSVLASGSSPSSHEMMGSAKYTSQSLIGYGSVNNPSGITSAFGSFLLPLKGNTKTAVSGAKKRKSSTPKKRAKSKTVRGAGKKRKRVSSTKGGKKTKKGQTKQRKKSKPVKKAKKSIKGKGAS